jgi:hypothetical protein
MLITPKKNSGKNGVKCSAKDINRQARGSSADIKHLLGNTAEVTGYVSPGSRLETISNLANKEIKELTKKDTLIIWGGTNVIAINESDRV